MIVDSSAIIAILLEETGHESLVRRLLATERKGVAASALFESLIVLAGRTSRSALEVLERFVQQFDLTVIPFSSDHWRAASAAFLRFGKGRHPAALNFGDCMSYATAKLADRPLLYVGEDFGKTDVRAA